jgi:hypothetical protein
VRGEQATTCTRSPHDLARRSKRQPDPEVRRFPASPERQPFAGDAKLQELGTGELHRFADWPNEAVLAVAAGAYTVWEDERLVYAGMAGRSLTEDSILEHRTDPTRVTGLRSRLASHASGRRSGDQFCVYVADRLVLPRLEPEAIQAIAAGATSFDALVREYIHTRFGYRFVEAANGARELERAVREGQLSAGKPFLNPA